MAKNAAMVPLTIIMLGWAFSYSYGEDANPAPVEPVLSVTENVVLPDAAQPPQESLGTNTATTPVATITTGSQETNVSLDFREADIRNVLRILAYKSGINIVAGPEVVGVVTIQLNDVPWQKALDVILATYGYGYDKTGNIITVTTIENLKKRREDALLLSEQEPLATKTFTLNFAKASLIIQSIEKMKTVRGSINYDDRTNSIIVRDIPSNLDLISEVIRSLDSTTPQVLIEAKIIETTLSNTENLGIDWVLQATVSAAKRPTTWPFDTSDSSSKSPGNFASWATLNSMPDKDDFSYGTINFSQMQAVLELLRSRTDTNILSNPRIVTLDNQKADIKVGTQYPIPTYTYNEEQAKLQVSGWEYKDIGILFDVTPHVNQAGFVTLDIKPTVTDILDFVTVENTQLPRLSNESTSTQVMIKDGETLVIAGLIKDKITNINKKVPFIGDIPLLGALFQKSNKTVSKTDLLIFLTPHIITPNLASEKSSTSP